jgi:CDP-4-dehydro-6-deoxyglucose reductase, E1
MIPLIKNTFFNEEETKRALSDFILNTQRLSMSTKCAEFEEKFAEFQGNEYAILFNSGGSANLALIQALKNLGKIKNNDKIGFSALTWSTNVMPLIQLGFKAIPIDCDRTTLNVSSKILSDVIYNQDIKAFFITNALGFAGDLDKIKKLCEQNGVILIEDNCESLGSELITGKTGNFGVASTFSFYVAHHISTIEGGMVCTNNIELAQMLRLVRANGWDRDLMQSQKAQLRRKYAINNELDAKYVFYDLGYNLRPTEVTGFLGSHQMQYINNIITAREKNFYALEVVAKHNPELISINHSHMKTISNFAYPVVCKSPELRKKYIKRCEMASVEIRPIIAGNIQKQPFYSKYIKEKQLLVDTDFLHNCGFYFGNYPELTKEDLEILKACLMK